jgi:hypothetical protein
MSEKHTCTDAVALVDDLDPERIRAELDELSRRESALRVLLRAAVARQRGKQRGTNAPPVPEVPHA